jgi:hypothetical protein
MTGILCATGVVSITMAMSLRRFIADDSSGGSSAERFEQLRGTSAFAQFLKHELQPDARFVRDSEEAAVEEHGYELGVFRRYLIENYFFPTYRLVDSAQALRDPRLQAEQALAERLRDWTFKLRLTRNGTVVVKLERTVTELPLIAISELVAETQRLLPADSGEDLERVPTQRQLALNVVAQFVAACGTQFMIRGDSEQNGAVEPITLRNDTRPERPSLLDRHLVFLFSALSDGGRPVRPSELEASYSAQVAGLLGNGLLIQPGAFSYPDVKPAVSHELFAADLATWTEELCLIRPEATLICYDGAAFRDLLLGGAPRRADPNYAAYWRSIVRGIEHLLVLKNELQIVERETTKLLERVPEITRRATDGSLNEADRQAITALATGIATQFRSLPQLRDLLVPTSVFRSSGASRKFERLMQLLGLHEIERHIQVNVEELSAFLTHFNSVQIQYDAEQNGLVFARLTVLFSILVLPSCAADFSQILLNRVAITQLVIQFASEPSAAIGTLAQRLWLVPLLIAVPLSILVAISWWLIEPVKRLRRQRAWPQLSAGGRRRSSDDG